MNKLNNKINQLSAEEIIKAINELDGELRFEALGIDGKHYTTRKPEVKREFYLIASRKIHPDLCKLEGTERAFSWLNQIYNHMLGK